MIPKRIFYIWFGHERPHWLEMTVFSWKEALSDFEIIEVNEESPYFDFEYEYNNCEFFITFYFQLRQNSDILQKISYLEQ